MNELEQAIEDVVERLDLPEPPDVAPTVLARISSKERRTRRALALVAAAAMLASGAALSVPASRSAILTLFRIGSVTIQRQQTLPTGLKRTLISTLGHAVTLREAEHRLSLPLLALPARTGLRLEHAYARPGVAVLTYSSRAHGQLLLTEIAYGSINLVKKLVGPETAIQPVHVGRHDGYWVTGAPHVLEFQGPSGRLWQTPLAIHGNVLVWQHGDLTLRLEGKLTRREAIDLAKELRDARR